MNKRQRIVLVVGLLVFLLLCLRPPWVNPNLYAGSWWGCEWVFSPPAPASSWTPETKPCYIDLPMLVVLLGAVFATTGLAFVLVTPTQSTVKLTSEVSSTAQDQPPGTCARWTPRNVATTVGIMILACWILIAFANSLVL